MILSLKNSNFGTNPSLSPVKRQFLSATLKPQFFKKFQSYYLRALDLMLSAQTATAVKYEVLHSFNFRPERARFKKYLKDILK